MSRTAEAAKRKFGRSLTPPPARAKGSVASTLSTQASQLLPELFRGVDEERRLSVLHVGTPCSDTMEFFSGFRCRLQVIDLFSELPPPPAAETERGLEAYFADLLQLSANCAFDVCLFWDLFDYLDDSALPAFLTALQPYTASDCRAHGFSVHNPRTPANNFRYGILDGNTLSLRQRTAALPGYSPHTQHQLNALLRGFRMERSVLLSDRRLELLLRAKGS